MYHRVWTYVAESVELDDELVIGVTFDLRIYIWQDAMINLL